MSVFRLNCIDPSNGERVALIYDSEKSTLKYEDGRYAVEPLPESERKKPREFQRTKLGDKNIKRHEIKFLRVVLGTKCNYKCAYCSQAFDAPEEQSTSIGDVDKFMSRLDEWLSGEPKRIELWGGEPLVYIKFLRKMLPKLREKFPNTQITTITNGSLLTDAIVDFLVKYKVAFSISHDAYGQSIRGDDILDDPKKIAIIDRASRLVDQVFYPTRSFTFNTTFNKKVIDPIKAREFFVKKFGHDMLVSADPVLAVGRAEIDKDTIPSDEQLPEFAQNVATAAMLHPDMSAYSLFRYERNFINGLKNQTPMDKVGQKCDVDRDSSLVVDILGNVYTCQNFVKKGDVKGSVYKFDDIHIKNVQHFSNRKCCRSCPFVHLCMGGCPAIQGNAFAETCKIKFAYYAGLFVPAIYHACGLIPVSIEAESPILFPVKELIQTNHGKHFPLTTVNLPNVDWKRYQKYAQEVSHERLLRSGSN